MSDGVDVYILQARDLFRSALCFGKSVFEFTTQDERGPVSCFCPHNNDITKGIVWKTSSRIKISEDFDTKEWSSAVHCAVLTHKQFAEYRSWLQEWLEENNYYTVLEGGSNIRKFISDSLITMQRSGGQISKSHLFLPEVCTYVLGYSAKELCSAVDIQSISEWFGSRKQADLHCTVQGLNSSDHIYYHESSSRGERYWSVSSPQFRLHSEKISLPREKTSGERNDIYPAKHLSAFSALRKSSAEMQQRAETPTMQQQHIETSMIQQNAEIPVIQQFEVAVTNPISVALPISVAPATVPITTIPILSGLTPAGGNTMLVIIILVAVLILIIFFAIVYYAGHRSSRVMRPATIVASAVVPM